MRERKLTLIKPAVTTAQVAALLAAKKTLTDYANVVVVDAGGNGDYTTLSAALAAITDASVINRYGIVMMPGIHTEPSTINLKEGVDVGALIPGTVQINAAASLTGGLIQVGGTSAITEKVTLFGLNFKMPDGATGNLFQMNSAYVAQVSIRDCKFHSDSGTPCVGTAGTLGSLLEMINCEIQCGDSGGTSVVSINSSYPVVLDKCTITQNQVTGTISCVLIVHATPVLKARHCTVVGGAYSFRAGSARTASIALCAMQKAMNNVTSTITTPYNVIDANL